MLKWKLLLLSSVFCAPDEPAADTPEDERIEVDTSDDDETPTDPVDEPEGAEGEDDEVEAASDDEPEGEQPAPVSRAERRIRALDDRVKNLASENARITRELEQQRRAPAQQVQEDPRAEADRLALMSPEDRIQYGVDKALARHSAQQNAVTFNLMDQSDRLAFESQQAAEPLAKKLAPEVERRLAEVRASGQNLPRKTVYTYLVGERVLAQQAKGKKPAAERTRRETVRPSSARGDVTQSRTERRGQNNSVSDIESRYGDVPI